MVSVSTCSWAGPDPPTGFEVFVDFFVGVGVGVEVRGGVGDGVEVLGVRVLGLGVLGVRLLPRLGALVVLVGLGVTVERVGVRRGVDDGLAGPDGVAEASSTVEVIGLS
ncbi:hypothetical protein [Kribbella shirazensis]|uniref:Uncharacterized protein n=1 Tax=Kribbella shirazensis TaxID=1105143 RepID=A0A7X5VJB6_9ACTN|nr:hypothetical protein [Kribbella shirazensis]NIK62336.1 hypothetical protein [Kribbella shirazensis]